MLFGRRGVLCDDSVWERWWFQVLSRLGVRADFAAFHRIWKTNYLDHVHRGETSICDAFRQLMLSYGLAVAQVDELALACHARWRRQQEETLLLPGVRRTLVGLAESGWPMGVLCDSSCSGDTVRERLEGFGLTGVFASVISSFDLGQTKPRPIGYMRSARDLGLKPHEMAFVGHRTAELEGAALVGMQTVAFNYEADARADVMLGRFEQLLDLFHRRDDYAAAG
jgi:phosphoglycolate phosphatase-like HAD superfamily hydrolase